MKTLNNILLKSMIAIVLSMLTFTACSDWNEVESITINEPNIADQNAELYAQYLENLKGYKNNDHRLVLGWFDNSIKKPFSGAQHINELPDSLDIVVLMFPENLTDFERKEMTETKELKGTKFIYTIDYEGIKENYEIISDTNKKEASKKGEEEAPTLDIPDYMTFMIDSVSKILKLADQYDYDGISITYYGKGLSNCTEAERIEELENQNLFMGMINSWYEHNTDKVLVFEGLPQNILDKTFLSKYTTIILPLINALDESQLDYQLSIAQSEGVPTDRFGVKISTPSLNEKDTETGYFSNGKRVLPYAANWITANHSNCKVNSLAIMQINNDYYTSNYIYQYTRKAIDTLNPSFK